MMVSERFPLDGVPFPVDFRDYSKTDGGNWGHHSYRLGNYLIDFRVLDQEMGEGELERMLEPIEGIDTPVIVDLLSSTAMVSSYQQYQLEGRSIKALAVGYQESRDDDIIQAELARGIMYLAANINDDRTWDEMKTALGESKAHIVISRGGGGLRYTATRPDFYEKRITDIWSMLREEDGIGLLQLPPQRDLHKNGIAIAQWVRQMQRSDITCYYVPEYASDTIYTNFSALIFQRKPGLALPACPSVRK